MNVVRPLHVARREPDQRIVVCLEDLLARAKAGEIVAFAYFVEDITDTETGYHGNLWNCLAGLQRVIHKIHVAIDRA